MAALTESGAKRLHGATVVAAAEAWGLTEPVKRVDITNRSAGAAFVTLKVTDTFVADDTGVVVAVADADETFVIPTGTTRTVFNSRRKAFVRGSIIGNTTSYDVEGFSNSSPEVR